MNLRKQITTVIARGRPVTLTTKDGDTGVVTITKLDRRHFETKDGGKFDVTDVKSITEAKE